MAPNNEIRTILNENIGNINDSLTNKIRIENLSAQLGVSNSCLRLFIIKNEELKKTYYDNGYGEKKRRNIQHVQCANNDRVSFEIIYFVKEFEYKLLDLPEYSTEKIINLSKTLAIIEKNVLNINKFTSESRNNACDKFFSIITKIEDIPLEINDIGTINYLTECRKLADSANMFREIFATQPWRQK